MSKKLSPRELRGMAEQAREKQKLAGGEEFIKPEKKVKAGAIDSPAFTSPSTERQVRYLSLPVSKREVKCSLISMDPEELVVAPYNKRSQELLTANNPAILKLKESIRTEKQREPILIRKTTADKYEVVYGSRRRFALELLKKEAQANGEPTDSVKVAAWYCGEISDADARRLSDAENDDHEAISPYEMALYYQQQLDENPNLNRKLLALQEGVSAATITSTMSLLTVPFEIVASLESPSLLTKNGVQLLNRLEKKVGEEKFKAACKTVSASTFVSIADAISHLEEKVVAAKKEGNVAVIPKSKPWIKVASDGKLSAKITAHRTEPGQYKVDIAGMDAEQLAKLREWLDGLIE